MLYTIVRTLQNLRVLVEQIPYEEYCLLGCNAV
jgi:hypothetical protein